MNHDNDNSALQSSLRQAAGGTVIVTLVFGTLLAALLSVSLYHYLVTDPARAVELEELKELSKQSPANTSLAEQIGELDIQLRRDQFARLYFLQRGTLLLIANATVLIAAALIRTRHLRVGALPETSADRKKEQIHHAMQVRTAVTLAAIALGAVGLYLAQRPIGIEAPPPQTAQAPAEAFATFEQMRQQWPAFRGADGSGVCTFSDIPADWDGPTGRNILWKSPIPQPGHNSPVIWGDRVFLTGATETQQQIFCYDLNSGALLWTGDVTVTADPARDEMYVMEDTGHAASTAVTDGLRVCAIFAGGDVSCFTVDGEKLWQRHLGVPESAYGYAASLTAYKKNVIVQFDVGYEDDKSKLIALDWQTGKTAWQAARPVPNSWTSPTVVQLGQSYQLLASGSPWVIAYDPATGQELYRADCLSGDVAPTQIAAANKIIVVEPYNALKAINTEQAAGDITQTHLAWTASCNAPDISSPVSDGKQVWIVTGNGELLAFDIADGSPIYSQQLRGEFQASPSLVGSTLYLLSVKGAMLLVETGREYKEIKRLELGEKCYASPAFAPGKIVLRTEKHLYCIGKKP